MGSSEEGLARRIADHTVVAVVALTGSDSYTDLAAAAAVATDRV
jgi:hypothetical protein